MNSVSLRSFTVSARRGLRLVKRGLLVVEWLLWAVFFALALSFLALRYWVLPNIESYRPRIEASLSSGLGVKVEIGRIEAAWQGLHPDLHLSDVRLFDRQGRPAFRLPSIIVEVSWWSIPARELRLHELALTGADLDVRRTRDGKFVIAGIELADQPDGVDMSDWILGQRRVVIRESRLRWNDEKRAAPELTLSNIHFVLENSGNRHRLGLTADPPRALASRVDVRADLNGESLNRLNTWFGEIYADLKTIDLAAWRAWVEYPADIRSGQGGVRAWVGFNGDRLIHFSADIGLEQAQARLASNLPLLELARVSGRVGAREIAGGGKEIGFMRFGVKTVTGFEVSGRNVALVTMDGVTLSPADFSMKTLSARDKEPQRVELEANSLDLEPLAKIVEHLPLDAQLRKLLTESNPRGTVFDFHLAWRGEFDRHEGFTARARFAQLALDARGLVPGFSNLSGSVEASDKGGTLSLASRNAVIDLPRMFEESKLELESLSTQVGWSFPKGKLEVRVDNAVFANEDAAGTALALYRVEPGTPGYLELSARLSRGVGQRAYRYLPKPMTRVRSWLKSAVEKGKVDEAIFAFKGNLYDFPFSDPKRGSFRAALKVSDASLLYVPGWPKIDNIHGDLVFERATMEFRGNTPGNIGAAKLGRVDVKIADLTVQPRILDVTGSAEGTTQAFLKFIDDSPLDEILGGFTQPMRASGAGKLALKLSIPLEEPTRTRVSGQYQFTNNDVTLDADLPQMSRVNGVLAFTEAGLSMRGIRGEALGGGFTLTGGTRADGVVALGANGNFTLPGIRAWLDDPVFAAMSGGTPWRAAINVRPAGGEVTVESSLVGVAVDLPAPLGKLAADSVAFKVVKTAVPGARDEDDFTVTLDRALSARVQRRFEGGHMRIVRAAAGIGEEMPALPRTGVVAAVTVKAASVDLWKSKLLDPRAAAKGAVGAEGLAALAPVRASVNAETLDVAGKRLHNARLSLVQEANAWVANVSAQELAGALTFRQGLGADSGRLVARLKHLQIPAAMAKAEDGVLDRFAQELPGADVAIDSFEVGDKKLGRLEFVANNQGGEWRIQRLNLANPDGVLAGSGAWKARRAGETRRKLALDFTLEAYDAGKLLDRLGFPATLKAGSGRLEGNVGWDGSPLAIDYPSLAGNLSLRVEKGQFLKADPGVGKLLGIMSLQALPRRLSLDFRDVFSEGFAFDLVSASSRIDRGILATSDFKMVSVSAVVLMEGIADLARETQDLSVTVLPDMSGGMVSLVGVIAGAINPAGALLAYLAQRVLKDPISKAFSFRYGVSGSWSDPKVARLQNPQVGHSSPGDPTQRPDTPPAASSAAAEAPRAAPEAPRAASEGPRAAPEAPLTRDVDRFP